MFLGNFSLTEQVLNSNKIEITPYMSLNVSIKTAGIVGAIAVILIVGYLLYDKNPLLSALILFIGLALVVAFVISEIYFKKQRHDAPWLYQ